MNSIALVTSVPDLHTARILASAGVPYISFKQDTANLQEILSWLEGPEVGIQIENPNLTIPRVDFLIVKDSEYDMFSLTDKKIFWLTADEHWSRPFAAVYPDDRTISELQPVISFLKYRDDVTVQDHFLYWLDYVENTDTFDRIFLS